MRCHTHVTGRLITDQPTADLQHRYLIPTTPDMHLAVLELDMPTNRALRVPIRIPHPIATGTRVYAHRRIDGTFTAITTPEGDTLHWRSSWIHAHALDLHYTGPHHNLTFATGVLTATTPWKPSTRGHRAQASLLMDTRQPLEEAPSRLLMDCYLTNETPTDLPATGTTITLTGQLTAYPRNLAGTTRTACALHLPAQRLRIRTPATTPDHHQQPPTPTITENNPATTNT